MPNRDIRIARDGEELGTFTSNEVGELLAGGFLKSADMYWMPGLPDWQLIGEAFKAADPSSTPSGWLTIVRHQVVERSSDVVARVGELVERVRAGTAEGGQSLSKVRQMILEEQLPYLQKLLAAQLKDKPLAATRNVWQNDELMGKAFGALYDCLPKPVCRFIAEEAFVHFCLEHRERLLKPTGQAGSDATQIELPPENQT